MSSSERALKHQGGTGNRYTDQQILDEIHKSARRHGKLRSHLYVRDYYDGYVSITTRTIKLRFGSWNNAARAAGYEPALSTAKYYKPYTREECVQAVLRVAELLDGELPSTGDYKNVRICEPEENLRSVATVRAMFGGRWVEVLRAAEKALGKSTT